jgi:hypothetical protein
MMVAAAVAASAATMRSVETIGPVFLIACRTAMAKSAEMMGAEVPAGSVPKGGSSALTAGSALAKLSTVSESTCVGSIVMMQSQTACQTAQSKAHKRPRS